MQAWHDLSCKHSFIESLERDPAADQTATESVSIGGKETVDVKSKAFPKRETEREREREGGAGAGLCLKWGRLPSRPPGAIAHSGATAPPSALQPFLSPGRFSTGQLPPCLETSTGLPVKYRPLWQKRWGPRWYPRSTRWHPAVPALPGGCTGEEAVARGSPRRKRRPVQRHLWARQGKGLAARPGPECRRSEEGRGLDQRWGRFAGWHFRLNALVCVLWRRAPRLCLAGTCVWRQGGAPV